MFEKPASEKDYNNERIKYRIVNSYEQAYRYNSPGGHGVPKSEHFIDINETNYKSENRKREKQMIDMSNNRNNYNDLEVKEKSIFSKIGNFIWFIIELIT